MAGSAGVLPSKRTAPLPSTMQTLIAFSDTSSATYCSIAAFPEPISRADCSQPCFGGSASPDYPMFEKVAGSLHVVVYRPRRLQHLALRGDFSNGLLEASAVSG